MKLMSKIDRICAWILLFSIVIYVISGFDIQGRFLEPQISSLIHLKFLFLPAELAFMFHASYGMNFAFRRWKLKFWLRWALIVIFLALNVAFIVYYFYIQFFRL